MLSISTSKEPLVFVLDPEVEKHVKIESGIRKQILEKLYEEPMTVSQLAREYDVSHTTIAHHLLRMLEDGEVEIDRDFTGRTMPQEKYYRVIARRVTIRSPPRELRTGMDSFMNNLNNFVLMGLFRLMETYKEDLPSRETLEDLLVTLNGALFYSSLTLAGAMPYFFEFISKMPKEDIRKFEPIAKEFFNTLMEGGKPVREMVEKLHKMGLKAIDEADERVREYYIP